MFNFIVIFYYLSRIFTEGRVFCEDRNAQPWSPFGYSCPILCETVLNAVKRLKIMDYKKTVFQDLIIGPIEENINEIAYNVERSSQNAPNSNEINSKDARKIYTDNNNIFDNVDNTRKFHNFMLNKKSFEHYYSKLEHEKYKPMLNYSDNNIDFDKEDAKKYIHKLVSLIKMANNTRKSNFDSEFVNIMTNILNKYVLSSFKFTQEMTRVILEKLFHKNQNKHYHLYDVNKLLKYLRRAVQMHSGQDNNYVITLKPKNCLSISLPGCACKKGYVERSGRCVAPSQCIQDDSLLHYLDRITLL